MRNYWQFLQQGWPLLVFGFLAVFFGNFGQSFFISWYGAAIQADLNLSASTYGAAYSFATLVSGSALMFVGGWIDKWSLRRFASTVALGLFVGCLTLAFTHNIVLLVIGFFLVRLFGQGLFPHTGITTMARSFDKNRGKALSIATMGVPVGEVILPILAVLFIAKFGWQMSWAAFALLIPVVFIPCMLFVVRRAHQLGLQVDSEIKAQSLEASVKDQPATQAVGRKQVLRDYRFWLALPVMLSGPFVVTGVFIHQGFILAQKQWSPEWFAACFIFYGVVHGLGSMGVGFLIDRFSATRLLPFKALPIVFALLLLAFANGPWVAWAMLGLLGVSIGCGGPIGAALWAEVYGTEKLGAIRSMTSSFAVWSTAVSPILFGVLIDNGMSIQALMSGVAVYVSAATLMGYMAYRVKK
ncbi:MFS transporter [Saccharophagus degradans]|uniref:Major facilitator superfamily MFS_1 n=1 Tax=Saccharophagus degradans (strain 2-40 / ATCC 43961 / DSM 17024) TaxID=203122 RepID=Q21H94_SACD2|nr:MFS transporter [Saccharophagus degradans]ABD81935.1 major facilitator superfamily MFS_1 [Saccharophagus degradans 2-40]